MSLCVLEAEIWCSIFKKLSFFDQEQEEEEEQQLGAVH